MAENSSRAAPANRPLSPHLGIYRWQWTMVFSILHRMTGVALTVGTLLLVYWLVAAALGPEAYRVARGFLTSWIGVALLIGWSAAFYYHLFNGIRHLFWDAGKGFELKTAEASAWFVLLATVAATGATWLIVLVSR